MNQQQVSPQFVQPKKSKLVWILLIILVILVGGGGYYYYKFIRKPAQPPATQPTTPTPTPNQPVKADLSSITKADNNFGFNLYQELLKSEKEKNLFISPASIAMALTMASNGAATDTAKEMNTVLGLKDLDAAKVNQVNSDLAKSLTNSDADFKLSIANSLWADKNYSFEEDFINTNKEFFSADVKNLDFSKPESLTEINKWVNDKTNGKIDKILSELSPQNIMVLINAIYFKASWLDQFEKDLTVEKDFNHSDGSKTKIQLMTQGGKYKYLENDNFQAIALPYQGGKASMYIFLPSQKSSLVDFQKELNFDKWQSYMDTMNSKEGNISLPKFKIEYEKELNLYLKNLGLELAFDPKKADFSKMIQTNGQNVYISLVMHKTYVNVDEAGTEAAAVTATAMATAMPGEPVEKFTMVVDRPFFFAIRDEQSGLILFMGSILDPS